MSDYSILLTVVEISATIFSITIAYLVFLYQAKKNQLYYLNSQFIIKSQSLVDFINREISPAYERQPFLRVDYHKFDDVIESLTEYLNNRKNETPVVDFEDVKRLIVLLSISEREKEEILNIKNNVDEFKSKPLMDLKSFIVTLLYFVINLFMGLLSLYMVHINHIYKNLFTNITIIMALLGMGPISYLIYELQFKPESY